VQRTWHKAGATCINKHNTDKEANNQNLVQFSLGAGIIHVDKGFHLGIEVDSKSTISNGLHRALLTRCQRTPL
jgi:hypothetical protein